MNTVANTSRTACGYGCTCCLTQVLRNSHTLITEYSVHMKPLDSAAFQMHLFILPPPPPQSVSSFYQLVLLRILGSCFLLHAWVCVPLPPSPLSLHSNRFCVFSETLAARQLCPFWVMTSSAAGRPGCSASVPKRVWWLARRCVSRNTLYPNADLIRPDCSPSYFIQNRERGAGWGLRGGDQGLKMKLKKKQPQLEYVYRQGEVPVLTGFSRRLVRE